MACGVNARVVVDQAGRSVNIPDRIQRVYVAAPPLMVLAHAISPNKLIGLSFAFEEEGKRFISPQIAALPVLGVTIGSGPTMNPETVMRYKPDLALAWASPFSDQKKLEDTFKRMGLPVVFVRLNTYNDWPAALEFTGAILGSPKRGKMLAAYMRTSLKKVTQAVSTIPENEKVRVYYAEGVNGLMTDCHSSFHTEVIKLAGGHNVYRCKPKGHYGMEPISLEQVLAYDPQVIIAQDRHFVAKVKTDPRWRRIRAVREGRIYSIPHWPFNWFDRPPSTMRALGIQWLAQILYPERFKVDMRRESKFFYKLFLGVPLSNTDLDRLLAP